MRKEEKREREKTKLKAVIYKGFLSKQWRWKNFHSIKRPKRSRWRKPQMTAVFSRFQFFFFSTRLTLIMR